MFLLATITSLVLVVPAHSLLQFPPHFKFGTATSAYQIEGGWNASGKSESNWDRLTHTTRTVLDGTNGDIACDSYNKWQNDINIISEMNLDTYRFSLAWTRLLPNGYTKEVNPDGERYYNNLINGLIAKNIEPIITLYHWDMPQKVTYLGGLTNPNFVQIFENYARIAFGLFGDRVKTWITFNEPNIICHYMPAMLALQDPNSYPIGLIEYHCTKNLLLSHAKAYQLYQNEFKFDQNGRVGITLNFEWSEPKTDSPLDVEAAERRRQFDFGLFANPIINFDYPKVVIERVAERSTIEQYPGTRLQLLTLEEKLQIHGSYDFLGLNHYTTWYVENGKESELGESGLREVDSKVVRSQDPSWPSTGVEENRVVPFGLRKALKWIKETYQNPEIIITECGYSNREETINDGERVSFYQSYLTAAHQAIVEDEVNLTGFMAWSMMDNFEWNQGYVVKFGLCHVDFDSDERTRKQKVSAAFYKRVATSKSIP